jgi:hypothetical protein
MVPTAKKNYFVTEYTLGELDDVYKSQWGLTEY